MQLVSRAILPILFNYVPDLYVIGCAEIKYFIFI